MINGMVASGRIAKLQCIRNQINIKLRTNLKSPPSQVRTGTKASDVDGLARGSLRMIGYLTTSFSAKPSSYVMI